MEGCVLAGSRIDGKLRVDMSDVYKKPRVIQLKPNLLQVLVSVDFENGESMSLTVICEQHDEEKTITLHQVIWRDTDITSSLTAKECDHVLEYCKIECDVD